MRLKIYLGVFLLLLVCSTSFSFTRQMPEWYRLTAYFKNAPQMNKSVMVIVRLTSLIGNIKPSGIKLKVPDGWKILNNNKKSGLIKQSESELIQFEVVPTSYAAEGSILIEANINVPKEKIKVYLDQHFPDTADKMTLLKIVVASKLAASGGEARRLFKQGGIKIDQQKVTDASILKQVGESFLIQAGKRKFKNVTLIAE